jgi:hypothetical protein
LIVWARNVSADPLFHHSNGGPDHDFDQGPGLSRNHRTPAWALAAVTLDW